jgi:hypothetical protein
MLHSQNEDDDRLDAFMQLANEQKLSCHDGSELTARDIVRLLLALRYDGLESGIYHHVDMLNHDCHPNFVKFRPTVGYSQVRMTRPVVTGESLTISYLSRIVSHATRRKHLWDQHWFDIGVSSLGEWRFMEVISTTKRQFRLAPHWSCTQRRRIAYAVTTINSWYHVSHCTWTRVISCSATWQGVSRFYSWLVW